MKEVCEKNLRNSVERIQRICETKVSVGFFDVYYLEKSQFSVFLGGFTMRVIEGNDDDSTEDSDDDNSDMTFLLIGLGIGGLVVFGILFVVVYIAGHHFGKHKHGEVVAPKEEEEKKVDGASSPETDPDGNVEEESPVLDMKTGEQYRVRALSKHKELEDYMTQVPARKTRVGGTTVGVKKAWI